MCDYDFMYDYFGIVLNGSKNFLFFCYIGKFVSDILRWVGILYEYGIKNFFCDWNICLKKVKYFIFLLKII